MAKLVVVLLFLAIVIYPIYLVNDEKLNRNSSSTPSSISDLIIEGGKYFIYDENLSVYGNFEKLTHKKFYEIYNLFLFNIKNNESINASKTIYNKNLFFEEFFYKNRDYNFSSANAFYDLNYKIFKGKDFFLVGKDYNASGRRFILDKNKNINATYTIFNLKVN